MKLYLFTRKKGDRIGWDEYVGFVVAAESRHKAEDITSGLYGKAWTCTLLSETAEPGIKAGILLDSFNAG